MSTKRRIDPRKRSDAGQKAALGIGAAALMIVCCAGPALVAGGALAAAGHFFAGPFAVVLGLLLAGAGIALAVTRRHQGGPDCCSPPSEPAVEDSGDEGLQL